MNEIFGRKHQKKGIRALSRAHGQQHTVLLRQRAETRAPCAILSRERATKWFAPLESLSCAAIINGRGILPFPASGNPRQSFGLCPRTPRRGCFLPFLCATQKGRPVPPHAWRRERDLNPCIHSCITRFRIVRVQPLRHLCVKT